MKAFIIKSNNDTLYLSNSPFYKWTNDFCEARIEKDRDDMGQILDKVLNILCDGKIVEITITEEDLEQQLAIYKGALKLACDSIRDMYCSDYCLCTRDERCNGKCCYEKYYNKEQFLDQAKKELEEQKCVK